MSVQSHLKKTFLAGTLAAIPVAATIFVIYYVESTTRKVFAVPYPFVGVLIAVAAIYLVGLLCTSLIGQWFLTRIDRLLTRLPVLQHVYGAWKQVSLNPPGTLGIFATVVLVHDETLGLSTLAFTSGQPVPNNADLLCLYVPAAPTPTSGRIYFAHRSRCQPAGVTPEEAFKFLLSIGVYIPPTIASTPIPASLRNDVPRLA